MKHRKMLPILLALVTLMWSGMAAAGGRVDVEEGTWIEVLGYIQPSVRVDLLSTAPAPATTPTPTPAEAKPTPDTETDFFMRRARLMVKGQIKKKINYFLGTLAMDLGVKDKTGNVQYAPALAFADAWMEYVFMPEVRVVGGRILVPFSRHMLQGGGTLHGLDFHSAFLRQKAGYVKRDDGIMVRGLIAKGLVDYRLAITDGVEPVGESDVPRFSGRIGVNVFDAEPEFFLSGTYLGERKVLAFGLSYDLQPGVGGDAGDELYKAFAFDVLADIPLGDNGIVATLNAYYFGAGGAVPEGMGLWADLGYRITTIEPLVAFEWFGPKEGDKGKRTAVQGGVNWWIDGHSANLKLQWGAEQLDGGDDWHQVGTLQGQVRF